MPEEISRRIEAAFERGKTRMPFVKIANAVHHYVIEGAKEKPVLVFSNSLGSDLRIWDGVASLLVDHFRILRYDKRGHGLSDAPEPPYSIGELAQDVIGVMDALDTKAAVVCGISVGGLIAQRLALADPDRVRALVLCDTGARIGSVASWEERITTVRTHGLEAWVGPSMERWFTTQFRNNRPADVSGYANMLRRTTVTGYLGTCAALRDADFSGEVARISRPALVLCGAQDVATPPELGRELGRLIAGAEFGLIDDAAHLPCIEKPEPLVDRMLKFFREVHIV